MQESKNCPEMKLEKVSSESEAIRRTCLDSLSGRKPLMQRLVKDPIFSFLARTYTAITILKTTSTAAPTTVAPTPVAVPMISRAPSLPKNSATLSKVPVQSMEISASDPTDRPNPPRNSSSQTIVEAI